LQNVFFQGLGGMGAKSADIQGLSGQFIFYRAECRIE